MKIPFLLALALMVAGCAVTRPTVDAASIDFFCTFTTAIDCGMYEQAVTKPRATVVTDVARDGSTALRLQTLPRENRHDMVLSEANTKCAEGEEQWWAHSVYLPADFVAPSRPGDWTVVFDFHGTSDTIGRYANFQILAEPDGLKFTGTGGDPAAAQFYRARIGPLEKGRWYDFVYHVRWSSGSDGFMHAWVDGAKKLAHRGPTLFIGQGCYLKLANYHPPLGVASAVLHDRVVRGTSAAAVARTPLD